MSVVPLHDIGPIGSTNDRQGKSKCGLLILRPGLLKYIPDRPLAAHHVWIATFTFTQTEIEPAFARVIDVAMVSERFDFRNRVDPLPGIRIRRCLQCLAVLVFPAVKALFRECDMSRLAVP